jgi:hypothetical protein
MSVLPSTAASSSPQSSGAALSSSESASPAIASGEGGNGVSQLPGPGHTSVSATLSASVLSTLAASVSASATATALLAASDALAAGRVADSTLQLRLQHRGAWPMCAKRAAETPTAAYGAALSVAIASLLGEPDQQGAGMPTQASEPRIGESASVAIATSEDTVTRLMTPVAISEGLPAVFVDMTAAVDAQLLVDAAATTMQCGVHAMRRAEEAALQSLVGVTVAPASGSGDSTAARLLPAAGVDRRNASAIAVSFADIAPVAFVASQGLTSTTASEYASAAFTVAVVPQLASPLLRRMNNSAPPAPVSLAGLLHCSVRFDYASTILGGVAATSWATFQLPLLYVRSSRVEVHDIAMALGVSDSLRDVWDATPHRMSDLVDTPGPESPVAGVGPAAATVNGSTTTVAAAQHLCAAASSRWIGAATAQRNYNGPSQPQYHHLTTSWRCCIRAIAARVPRRLQCLQQAAKLWLTLRSCWRGRRRPQQFYLGARHITMAVTKRLSDLLQRVCASILRRGLRRGRC